MIAKDIEKMDFKELRETVKDLSEQLARFKRLFEDEVYNIDYSKLSTSVKKERDNMRSQLTISSNKIESIVEDVGKQNSKITQTADAIKTIVGKKVELDGAIVINSLDLLETADPNKTYVYYEADEEGKTKARYYCWITDDSLPAGGEWTLIDGDNIYSVFEQTKDGFNLKGNVVIDGSAVVTRNLKLQGNVTWEMDNSPVKTRYSSDGSNWHETFEDGDKWLQMSFDGGKKWTEPPTKVVGTDGKNGTNGTNATVTPQSVFDALTADGANQGIFAAFSTDEKKTKIYINSEYLATKIAEVADTLFIGDVDTIYDEKMIKFNESASISTFNTGLGYHIGLEVSTPSFRITGGGLDLTKCTGIEWGKNLPEAGYAVFG